MGACPQTPLQIRTFGSQKFPLPLELSRFQLVRRLDTWPSCFGTCKVYHSNINYFVPFLEVSASPHKKSWLRACSASITGSPSFELLRTDFVDLVLEASKTGAHYTWVNTVYRKIFIYLLSNHYIFKECLTKKLEPVQYYQLIIYIII